MIGVRITYDPPISVEDHCKFLQAYDDLYNIIYVLEEDTLISVTNHFSAKAVERVLENPGDFIPENQKLSLISTFTGSIGIIFTGTAKVLETANKVIASVSEIVRHANEHFLHPEQVREKIHAESKNIVAESRRKESEALINEEIANRLRWETLKSQLDKLGEVGVSNEEIQELVLMRVREDTTKILQTKAGIQTGFINLPSTEPNPDEEGKNKIEESFKMLIPVHNPKRKTGKQPPKKGKTVKPLTGENIRRTILAKGERQQTSETRRRSKE
jgi:hypothetical protein